MLLITRAICASRDTPFHPFFTSYGAAQWRCSSIFMTIFMLADVTPHKTALLQVQEESGGKKFT